MTSGALGIACVGFAGFLGALVSGASFFLFLRYGGDYHLIWAIPFAFYLLLVAASPFMWSSTHRTWWLALGCLGSFIVPFVTGSLAAVIVLAPPFLILLLVAGVSALARRGTFGEEGVSGDR